MTTYVYLPHNNEHVMYNFPVNLLTLPYTINTVISSEKRLLYFGLLRCVVTLEATGTSETSISFYQTARSNNPEDSCLHTSCRENLKSHPQKLFSLSLKAKCHILVSIDARNQLRNWTYFTCSSIFFGVTAKIIPLVWLRVEQGLLYLSNLLQGINLSFT